MLSALTPRALIALRQWLADSPVGNRLARGAFWALTGAVISRGLGLVAGIIVARMLGKEGFGQVGIIRGTIEMFGTFAGFGLGLTATKHVAEFRSNEPERAGRILSVSAVVAWSSGTIATVILMLIAPWLAVHSLAAPGLVVELRLGALLVLVGAVNGAQVGALSGFEAFKRIAQVNIWSGFASFPCLTLGTWLFGLPGAIGGLVVSQAFGCVLNRWALVQEARRARVPLWSHGWLSEFSVLWRFSLPAVLASSLVAPVYWACQTMLVHQASGYNQMADYAVGAQWRGLAQYVPSMLAAAYLPVAASVGLGNPGDRRRLMLRSAGLAGVLTAVIGALVFILAPWILSAYGHGFSSAKWVLMWMLLTAVFDSINSILVSTLMASGWAWLRLISNGTWAALALVCAFALVPRYGALGLALAFCVAQAAHLCLQTSFSFYITRRKL